jgi:ribose transport system substrate-binding protein
MFRKTPMAVTVAVIAAFGVSACGSSSSSSSSSASSGSTGSATTGATTSGATTSGSTATSSSSASTGAIKPDGSEKIVYSDPTGAQVGQQQIYQGMQLGAKEIGWTASQDDAALSPTKQVSDIQTMINQKQNGIASWTLDPGAIAGAYTAAGKAGIPVIGVNSTGTGVKTSILYSYELCGSNSPLAQTAAAIAKVYPHAKTLVIGGPPVPSIEGNVSCFTKWAKKDGLDIEATQDNTNDTQSSAQPIVAALLTKYPSTQAIWSYNDDSALGASAALTAAGKSVYDTAKKNTGGVFDVGANGDADAITAIKQGRETETWDNNNVATGIAIVKALQAYIGPQKVKSPPKQIVVNSLMYDASNINGYKAPADRGYTLANLPLGS